MGMRYDIATAELDPATKVFILNAYKKGLEFLSSNYFIIPDKVEELFALIRARKDYTGEVSSSSYMYFETDGYHIAINKVSNILLFACPNIAWCQDFVKGLDGFSKTKENGSINIDYFFLASHGVSRNIIEVNIDTMEQIHPGLYPDVDIDILSSEYMNDKDSILFLAGIPGVGKTTFMRYLLQRFAKRQLNPDLLELLTGESIAYVKDMSVMSQSQFWCELVSSKYNIIIFDDLDFGLATRDNPGNNIVSNLLSYSDGIFGSKAKIVITTNMAITDIDKALLRPGRCFDFLVLNPLTRSDALNAWITILNLPKEDFEAQWPDAKEITQSDLMSVSYRIRESRKQRTYVKKGKNIYNVEDKMKQMLSPVGFK